MGQFVRISHNGSLNNFNLMLPIKESATYKYFFGSLRELITFFDGAFAVF